MVHSTIKQHCTLHAFEQFGALYMHNHDDQYTARPGFEPGISKLQAQVDKNKPSGPAFTSQETPYYKMWVNPFSGREIIS